MKTAEGNPFSEAVSFFQGKRLPVKAIPAGYAALIDAYRLIVPLPRTLSATGEHHKVIEEPSWRIMTPRHAPENQS